MELVADILLTAGAFGAGIYCFVLSRRLNRFTNLESGVGAAVAVLSAQVEELQKALEDAQGTATHSNDSLTSLTDRAENAAKRLELMVAALHDVPQRADPEMYETQLKDASQPVFTRHNGDTS